MMISEWMETMMMDPHPSTHHSDSDSDSDSDP